jgi:hypothetical protein
VGTFRLVGTRTAASCSDGVEVTAPADGDAACLAATPSQDVRCQVQRPIPDCCFDTLFPRSIEVIATIAFDTAATTATTAYLCTNRHGATPYVGTRVPEAGGDRISVATSTSGAALGSCAAACAVTVLHTVEGLVARDPISGLVTGFSGEGTEAASATPAASCAPCATPCTATWSLAKAP